MVRYTGINFHEDIVNVADKILPLQLCTLNVNLTFADFIKMKAQHLNMTKICSQFQVNLSGALGDIERKKLMNR